MTTRKLSKAKIRDIEMRLAIDRQSADREAKRIRKLHTVDEMVAALAVLPPAQVQEVRWRVIAQLVEEAAYAEYEAGLIRELAIDLSRARRPEALGS